jgi:aspartate/methionine/tyrosine aminotransferase
MKTEIVSRDFGIHLSKRSRTLEVSKIREIAELGLGQSDIIPLWFGEGAWPSSRKIVSAANKALLGGDHFYQPNSGSKSLRQEIVRYTHRIYDTEIDICRVTVTASGMQGLALVAQAIVSPGDRVVVLEPGWPNISQTFQISGGCIHCEKLEVKEGHWYFDLAKMLAALTPETKAIVLNSPNNPTGWVMSKEDQVSLLAHCRKHSIWIVSDDVYSRLYADGNSAPSFLSLVSADDLFISINSFSKAWSMTGWRLGWIVAPWFLENTLAMLSEFNIAGPPGFIQQAGEMALKEGETELADLTETLSKGYALASDRLRNMSRVNFIEAKGAFYCFFSVSEVVDSMALAREILTNTRVGLAPGIAFGSAGEGFLRLCYAQPEKVLSEAFDRLEPYLNT